MPAFFEGGQPVLFAFQKKALSCSSGSCVKSTDSGIYMAHSGFRIRVSTAQKGEWGSSQASQDRKNVFTLQDFSFFSKCKVCTRLIHRVKQPGIGGDLWLRGSQGGLKHSRAARKHDVKRCRGLLTNKPPRRQTRQTDRRGRCPGARRRVSPDDVSRPQLEAPLASRKQEGSRKSPEPAIVQVRPWRLQLIYVLAAVKSAGVQQWPSITAANIFSQTMFIGCIFHQVPWSSTSRNNTCMKVLLYSNIL